MDKVANHPMTQSVTQGSSKNRSGRKIWVDDILGPMAEKAREEANKTSSQFSNVAASRQTPETTAATGQNLTHYHSMFYNILSWENPRVSAISYVSIIVFIFFTRYAPVLSLTLRGAYIVLGGKS